MRRRPDVRLSSIKHDLSQATQPGKTDAAHKAGLHGEASKVLAEEEEEEEEVKSALGGDGNEADASLMATARERADEEAAKAQLQAAIAADDAEELRRAIDFASRSGFTGQALEDARSLLHTILAREAAKKELKDAC